MIESDPALERRVRFAAGDVLLRINDRLHAPSTPETFEAVRPAIEATASRLFGSTPVALDARPASGTAAFTVSLRAESPPGVADLLSRLGD